MRLFEWHSDSFKEYSDQLPGFINYLSGVWQNRNRYIETEEETTEENEQEEKIQKQRFFDFTYDGNISARNYVGVVQYEDIRIEVYPKIFANDKSDNYKKWQLNLLYWLTYCRKIRFPFSFADVSKVVFDDYLELLIYIFANYTSEVLSGQPFQAYQKIEEETTYLKGRLSFEEYTKYNLTTGKWQNFFCSHEPFIYDNLFNQIIKYVTKRLSYISVNPLNKEKLNDVLFLLHDVSDIPCTTSDCDKVKLNPLFDDHKHILELCKLFLSNQVIDMDSEDNKNFCFLIPMEYIFEDFIFGFISSKWPSLNFISQSTDYLALNNGRKVFQIKNDIYLENKLIIDTKYKIRDLKDGKKAGVCQSDMYQMVSYAVKRKCRNILLLYPYAEQSLNTSALFQVPLSIFSDSINVEVQSIDIKFEDIHSADNTIYERIRLLNEIFRINL